ncbi:hypothetical protein D3C75_1344670 [compost metagenome]
MVTVSSSRDDCFNWSFLKTSLVRGMAASFSRSVAPTGAAGRTTACWSTAPPENRDLP